MKLVHAADLHVDSPLVGLSRYDGAPEERLRGATRRALENLVSLCLDEQARVLLLAGDLFDGDGRDQATGLFFARQLARLAEGGVRVVLVRGNHDAESRVFRQLRLGEHVHELARDRPGTWVDEGLGLAVHGQGFETRVVDSDLAAALPAARAGLFNVGLLHTSLDGRPGHGHYAPTRLEVLAGKGYDYWALGHVHAREEVCRDPWVVFPGNTQGRHVRETGAKGASVVTVEDGRVVAVEHRALDVLRWCHLRLDVGDDRHRDDVLTRVGAALREQVRSADERLLAVRVELVGSAPVHGDLVAEPAALATAVRQEAFEAGDLWIESVRVRTRQPLDLDAVRERDDPLGGLARRLAELVDDERALGELSDALTDLAAKLPAEVRGDPDAPEGSQPEALRLDDPALLAELVRDAEQLLLPRLLEAPEA